MLHPIRSRHSNALLTKSSEWPLSANLLGLGRGQSVGERGRRKTGVDPGEQRALGGLAMAHLCPAPQPALQNSWGRPAPEGRAFPPRGLTVTVGGYAARPVKE